MNLKFEPRLRLLMNFAGLKAVACGAKVKFINCQLIGTKITIADELCWLEGRNLKYTAREDICIVSN